MRQVNINSSSGRKRKNNRNQIKEEDVLYWIFIGFLVLAIASAAAVYAVGLEEIVFIPCPVKRLTGWYCPGCGGTRAIRALLKGEFIKSFLFHPLVPCAGVFLLLFLASHTLKYLTKGRIRGIYFRKGYLLAAVILIIENFLIKNYLLFMKGIDLLEEGF